MVDCYVVKFLQNNTKLFNVIRPSELKPIFETIDLDRPLADYDCLLEEAEVFYTKHDMAFHLFEYATRLNCPVVISAIAVKILISGINTSMDT
ncbi:MAG: hypothetical protein ABI045_00070 [Flavobacteriales bacterium]